MFTILLTLSLLATPTTPHLNHHVYIPLADAPGYGGSLRFDCPPEGGGVVKWYSKTGAKVYVLSRFQHDDGRHHLLPSVITIAPDSYLEHYVDMSQGWRLQRAIWNSATLAIVVYFHCT